MTRRKIIQESKDFEYRYVTTGGPKKYFNKKLVKVPGTGADRKEILPPIEAEWFTAIVKEIAPARRRKYLTQQQLAHFLKTSQAMISKLENGKANPTAEFLDRLFRVLGLSVQINFRG